jgi:PilZ domain
MRPAVQQDERRADRVVLTFKAGLRPLGGSKFTTNILDLSVTGFRCKTSYILRVGEQVSLTIPGLAPIPAHVRWAAEFEYGCSFDKSLHPAVLDHIALHSRKVRG